MSENEQEPVKKLAEKMQTQAQQRIEAMRSRLLTERKEALRKRNEAAEEFQRRVEESRKLIQSRQEFVKDRVSHGRIRKEVDTRMNRGFGDLERVIGNLRETVLGGGMLERMSFGPAVLDAIKAEAQKVMETEFFMSIQRQIDTEKSK